MIESDIECSPGTIDVQSQCSICLEHCIQSNAKIRIPCLKCNDRICVSCLRAHLHSKVSCKTGTSTTDLSCPNCRTPDLLANNKQCNAYLKRLTKFVSTHLPSKSTEIKKLITDRRMRFDPNFKRCPYIKCQEGFILAPSITNEGQLHSCRRCKWQFCAKCNEKWLDQHENTSCEKFAQWLVDNNASNQEKRLSAWFNNNNCLLCYCSNCKLKLTLEFNAECMHITCVCSFEFCRGCFQPFRPSRAECARFKCTLKGLHAHHPRYCAYYLRDYTIAELQTFLANANVIPKPSPVSGGQCIYKNVYSSKTCQKPMVYNLFKCCRDHCVEYLADLVVKNRLDPIPMMPLNEVMKTITRLGHTLPDRGPWDDDVDDDVIYKEACKSFLQSIPLNWTPTL